MCWIGKSLRETKRKRSVELMSFHSINLSSMLIWSTHRIRSLIHLNKGLSFPPPSSSSSFCTNTSSESRPFAVSYLINNLGFSPQSASKLSSTYNFRFKTAEKPNSVLSFFKNRGFSDSQLHNMIAKAPWLLSCDPSKRVLPKFEFFLSKGNSNSDIVNLVSKNPKVLSPSLNNHTVPTYEFLTRFMQSDKDMFALLTNCPSLFGDSRMEHNIRMLIENGITASNITRMLQIRSSVFSTNNGYMLKAVEELKDLGFHPSKSTFAIALMAKIFVSRTQWNEKVDMFKKWGWSDEDILKAFRRYPHCMLTSVDKINLVMSFWVNHLCWDTLALAKGPFVFTLSLERRTLPRATVLQFLLNKGLRKKNASLTRPFKVPEKLFIVSYIKRFEEHSSDLLKLYEEKMNLAHNKTRENTGIS